MRKTLLALPALLLALLCGASAAAETATLLRADSLRATPYTDGAVVVNVAAGAVVEIATYSNGWYQVKYAGKTGWVRMFSLRRNTATASTTASISGIAGVASGRTGTGTVVSATGVRGLDEGDLKAARYTGAQVKKAHGYRASRAEAEAHAKAGGLAARKVPALPAPEAKK